MFSSEIYEVEDCTYYNSNSVTSAQTVSINLPSAFEISFTVKRTHTSSDHSFLEIGGDTGNTALMGQVGSSGESEVRIYDSEGSSGYSRHLTSNNTINTDTLYKWVHNGTDNSFSMNSDTITWTDSKTHSKIRKLTINRNKVEGLKVKPL